MQSTSKTETGGRLWASMCLANLKRIRIITGFSCQMIPVSPIQPVVGAIVLKDLDHYVVTNESRPGTNIRYKITFGLDGVPGMLYKVVVNGKVVSLYEPDGFNPEWKEKFNEAKKKKQYEKITS